jgi:hypothetical protein
MTDVVGKDETGLPVSGNRGRKYDRCDATGTGSKRGFTGLARDGEIAGVGAGNCDVADGDRR